MCAQKFDVLIGPDALAKLDPESLGMAMQIIGMWSYIDMSLTNLMCAFVGGEYEIVSAIIAGIENDGARSAAFRAAAALRLQKDDPEGFHLFEKVLKKLKKKRSARNKYAHGIMAYSEMLPDAIILINPRHLASVHARYMQNKTNMVTRMNKMTEWCQSGRQGPRPADVERIPSGLDRDEMRVVTKHEIVTDLREATKWRDLTTELGMALDRRFPNVPARYLLSSALGMTSPDQTPAK